MIKINLLIILVLSFTANAIYKDQIGKIEWSKHLIGKSKTSFDNKYANDVLFSITDNNVLAAINTTQGNTIWRQTFDQEKILSFKQISNGLFTISGKSSQQYRVWDPTSGKLVWEHVVDQPTTSNGDIFIEEDQTKAVVTAGNSVIRFNLADGSVVWKVDLKTKSTTYGKVIVYKNDIYVLGIQKKAVKKIFVARLSLSDGSVKREYATSSKNKLNSKNTVILHTHTHNPYLVWREEGDIIWSVHKLGFQTTEFDIFHPKLLDVPMVPLDMIESSIFHIDLGTKNPMMGFTYQAEGKNKFLIAKLEEKRGEPTFTNHLSFSYTEKAHGKKRLFINQNGILATINVRSNNKAKFDVYDLLQNGKMLDSGSISIPQEHEYGIPESISVTGNSQNGVVSIQTNDGLTCAFNYQAQELKNTELKVAHPIWCKDQSLASSTDSVFVNIPDPNSNGKVTDKKTIVEELYGDGNNNLVMSYLLRVYKHAEDLTGYIRNNLSLLGLFNKVHPHTTDSTLYNFGFKKYVVFTTNYGKVAAYDTVTGESVWQRQLLNKKTDKSNFKRNPWLQINRIFNTRQTTRHSEAVIVVEGTNLGKNTVLTTLNGVTGEIISDYTLDLEYPACKILETNAVDSSSNQKVLIILRCDKDKVSAEIWPRTSTSINAISEIENNIYFVTGETPKSTKITGYKMGLFKKLSSNQNELKESIYVSDSVAVWELDFGKDKYEVISSHFASPNQKMASIGRILSDRNVLYKYLNPNAMLVLAGSQDSSYGLRALVVDTITGKVLHMADHPHAFVDKTSSTKPLGLLKENWAGYYFWNNPSKTNENDGLEQEKGQDSNKNTPSTYTLVSLEMFESGVPNEKESSGTFSSYNIQRPHISSKSYVLPYAVTAMGASTTHNGIAVQSLALAFRNQPLALIPLTEIDSLRPVGYGDKTPTSDYLMPYKPLVIIDSLASPSYNLSISGVSEIRSTSTNLESTSLVLFYGLDVFCTRLSPSGSFDVLSVSFSKLNLVATIVTLVVASIVTVPFVRRRVLGDLWE
ncbi:hypothetical protein BB558_001844 [Smittium angustum]|uniref:ER membrane protein complex subunit 1 n=1 Tax=Smittium angustum TaxID=133377 RepID=A0A2U1JAI1_SMIAN|nr:hypothetical protein BB558_001844 [Smittium angustum]